MHRRLRPEEFGGRVHNRLTKLASYAIPEELLRSQVLQRTRDANGSYLLPQAFPEGSPLHPSYPAGHAAIAGACTTILKAFFNESFILPEPVQASADGLMLIPYTGPALTLGGELNKLASNVSLGRDTAGLHYRSDGIEGMRFGETVALNLMRDLTTTLPEEFDGFSLTTFDGRPVRIGFN